MACATIHLAIAKKYLEKHKELNYEKVIAGTLYPDAFLNNDISHYTDINRGSDNVSHVRHKVNLYSFLFMKFKKWFHRSNLAIKTTFRRNKIIHWNGKND